MSYDVYYSTGGGDLIYGGSDVWVNHWIDNVAPKLKHPSKLMIHRVRPATFQRNKIDNLEIIWQGDEPKEFDNIIGNARRINILHGYYTPHKAIYKNKDKIYSNVSHVSLDLSMKAGFQMGIKNPLHFASSLEWESEVAELSEHNIWIGLDKTPLHDKVDNIIDIPNFYEFKNNLPTCMNNRVGFAARVETRKGVHYLDGVDSQVLTDLGDFNYWKKQGYRFEYTRVYQYKYDNVHRFFKKQDWGISHSCHLNEPFGYSIFQAVDYGKIPILARDWLKEYSYPFRAFGKEEFDKRLKEIESLSEKDRGDILESLRSFLKKYDNKEEWVNQYLQIYNS